MHHHYRDILSRITEPPKWWDECAVPRFCEFSPNEIANIYADEVVLLEIACQGCGARYKVAMSQDPIGRITGDNSRLLDHIDGLHYGDPPNTDCCLTGATMNSEPLRVLEAWKRPRLEWERAPVAEREIVCEWVRSDHA